MKQLWQKYAELFDARIFRERVIIALCILAAVYFVWDFAVVQSLTEKRQILETRYKKADAEIKKLSAEERVLSQALLNNPNAKKQREIVQLNDRLNSLDEQIDELSVGLVPAKILPDILQDILLARSDLSLLGLHALKPEKLTLVGASTEANNDSDVVQEDVGVFKHRVVLRVQGSYFSIQAYLAELEKSNWQFYWSALEYAVSSYPSAVAQIEVYTLSTEQGFIGE